MARKPNPIKPTVINRNLRGEIINPSEITITREMLPELYRILENHRPKEEQTNGNQSDGSGDVV